MPAENLISIETETRRQLFLLLCRNSVSSYVLNLIISCGVAFVALQMWQGGVLHPLAWLGGVGVLNLPFVFSIRRIVRNPTIVAGDAALTRAERIQFASTAVMGFGWTVAIFTYAPTGGLEFRLLLAAIIAGMGAGAVPKLVGASPHIEIFIGLLSVPVIPVCVMAGSSMDYVIAVGAVLYMYGVLESARHLRAALVTSTRLGLERLSLLASTR